MSLTRFFHTPGSAISARQKTGWIGVDIGTGAIKVSQLCRSGGRLSLARSLVIRADDRGPFDLQSFQQGRIGDVLHQALRVHGGFRGRQAACTVSMVHCQLRTLVSAKGSEDEQRELISLEMENDPNSSAEPLEFEFWDAAMGEHRENRGMTQVHVLSMPRSLSDSIANNLLRADLHCQILDAGPFAAVRAGQMMTEASPVCAGETCYAILDWGCSIATLMVVCQGQPLLTRTLRQCGLERILTVIRQRLKLSTTEAEAMLTTYGVSVRTNPAAEEVELQNLITELSSNVMRDLIEEIQETLSFMQLQFPQQMPRHLCLMGGGAAIRHIAALLQQQLCLPVHVWNPGDSPTAQISPVLAASAALSGLAWER